VNFKVQPCELQEFKNENYMNSGKLTSSAIIFLGVRLQSGRWQPEKLPERDQAAGRPEPYP
jgi:hypothetical protein